MNRCSSPPKPRSSFAFKLFLATCLAAISLSAIAQTSVRQFPKNALRGNLVVIAAPAITLDGKPDRLSPGARIRDAKNMLVMNGTLIGQTLVVNYTRESAGMVHEVWILNAAEAALPRKSAGK